MSTVQPVRQRIESMLAEHRVVLFMKGTRAAPSCGFSAATVGALNDLLDDYVTVDVLADEAIRQGIKDYGNWPTIPQLYVDGELVGGADIVQGMAASGELHELLGLPQPDRSPPDITISDEAAAQIRVALADADGMGLFLAIDGRFQPQFQLREIQGNEIRVTANGIEVSFDPASAQRARGAHIGWAETAQGEGLSIDLPAAPPKVHALDVQTLKRLLGEGAITLIDVRSAEERAIAPFAAAEVLDAASHDRLIKLDKGTPLAFLCHHGNSSRRAAEHFREHGFRVVHNVEGGIDAWSREVDPALPRY
ncbi:MAG TPA: Grx4 family monothiol glutaredoxin [Dokdonella sp.]|uniref:Grx4 family monothiol glutaredoxin n=2 Tax=Dokdonella sp. TaxID=2291710 RepID=UPI002C5FE240|nr:Grx4 family monothiol glutaredoxin [Dokdonella sp.]HOX70616.1 Grx4 family monothiol glutaredoxin [Dokdonella sp.]HOX71884.1 Grx4 family monothiol glutaredoxin [Dokdonella sp.]HPG93553.1 Grx4 family monothiol glutaredoxin [Dokdonella sp.]HPN78017.1 Grx4 family monothiol glutaredoxin [Dokdonella sp.]